MDQIILGTRGSDLALAQTQIVADKLRAAHAGLAIEIKRIKTTGDKNLDLSLSGSFDRGLFTKELEEALIAGRIDAAVHSLKDLPTDQPSELVFGAILERADSSDVLVSKQPGGLAGLPIGAVVATSSPRRQVQVLLLREDLRIVEIRGNVPTRLRKLATDSSLHGLLLAKAGLDRLGSQFLPPGLHVTVVEQILPAPGQGAIAVQCRNSDSASFELLRAIHHEPTALCVTAERDFLRAQGGGCHVAIAARAVIEEGRLILRTFPPS
ncbi:MAG TPA: hydroxymethylbilane synthase [Terrimicrobiaceae bacterium]